MHYYWVYGVYRYHNQYVKYLYGETKGKNTHTYTHTNNSLTYNGLFIS